MNTYFMSFVDFDKDQEQEFIGACIVRAKNSEDAPQEAWRRGCNPGGEMIGLLVPDDRLPDERWYNRTLTREEVEDMGEEVRLKYGVVNDPPEMFDVCASCNVWRREH
jgi:hypothetical protein